MFHRIILAVDLADPAPMPKGLTQALELAAASEGELRLVNVQPLLPATFMEYVPADFDEEQEKRAREAMDVIVAKIQSPKVKVSSDDRERRRVPRIVARGDGMACGPRCRRLAPARHVGLSARLERQDDRAACAMLGAGCARITECVQCDSARIAASSPSGVSANMRSPNRLEMMRVDCE